MSDIFIVKVSKTLKFVQNWILIMLCLVHFSIYEITPQCISRFSCVTITSFNDFAVKVQSWKGCPNHITHHISFCSMTHSQKACNCTKLSKVFINSKSLLFTYIFNLMFSTKHYKSHKSSTKSFQPLKL